MARSSSGRSVARAAATGGGTTYRGQMPVNWYAALVIIVLVGLGSVALAKYNYNSNAPAVQPTTNTTWHAALAIDICGTMEPALPATPAGATTGLTSSGGGVLVISPRSASEAGTNATLGKFASGYTGLTLTNTTIQYPHGVLYQNGERCAKGTPDAGKVGEVRARWWVLSTQTGTNGQPEQVGGLDTVQPGSLRFTNRQVITAFFGPDNATIPHASVLERQRAGRRFWPGTGRSPPRPRPRPRPPPPRCRTGDVDHGADLARPPPRRPRPRSPPRRPRRPPPNPRQPPRPSSNDRMKAVVLVGGEGTRLRPLTLTTPKQMLPVVGVPMLERVLGHLARHGVDEAVLSLGYLPDAFLEAYPDGRAAGVSLAYAVEPEPLDTAGAIRFAATSAGVDDTFVVVNGDVLTDLDLTGLVAFHRRAGAQGTIALHPVADPSAFGVVPTDADGRVTAFVEKPPRGEAPTNQINAGTYVLEPSVLKRIAE